MKPIVSVVIPVYNDEQYIHESVESALSQDYENLEVIVVDDGSSDYTPKILQRFGERIHCIRQENSGTAAALNKGIKNANGQLIAWLSSDDLFLPKKIKHQVDKFIENPSLALVYTDWIMIDSQGEEVKVVHCPCPSAERFVIEILKENFVNGSSVIIRREYFNQVGYFDETLPADSDGDMWFRMLKQGCRFGHLPIPLVKYRWHSGNLSHSYKLAESCKDRVRLKALQAFSPYELFGNVYKNQKIAVNLGYEQLALIFARQWFFQSASEAMAQAIHNSFSFKRRILRLMFIIIGSKPCLSLVLLFRRLRFWLITQLSFLSAKYRMRNF